MFRNAFLIADIGDWIVLLFWAVVIVGALLKKIAAAPKAPPLPRHLERPPQAMPPAQGPGPMLAGPGQAEKPSDEALRKFLRDLSRRAPAPAPKAPPPSQVRRPPAGPAHPQARPSPVKQAQRKRESLAQSAQKKEKELGTIRPARFEDISASFEMGLARHLQSLEEITGRKLTGPKLAPAEKARAAAAAVSSQSVIEERLSSLSMGQRAMLFLEIFGPPRALRSAHDPYSV